MLSREQGEERNEEDDCTTGLIGKQQVIPVQNLSDGQKSWGCLAWQNAHMLFLDELDIDTIWGLCDADQLWFQTPSASCTRIVVLWEVDNHQVA